MIAIVNIDETPAPTGRHLYSVRINTTELFRFEHFREDPISTLFWRAMRAAKAYESRSATAGGTQ